jgi:hypothetical protein
MKLPTVSLLKKEGRRLCKLSSVADLGCLSRIPDPDFCPSRIPDPKTATKERDEKKFVVLPFFSPKYHKTKNYFNF